jgi:uncharacterized protein (TIGR00297 family)
LQYILVVTILFVGVMESIRRRKLSTAGAIAGGLIGFFVYAGADLAGFGMLAAFFLAGTMATSWKREKKTKIGMAQEQKGERKLGQVLANGGVGGLLGLATVIWPQQRNLFSFLMAGAFSSAMADTLSSELGTLYGKKFYNIISLKADRKGLDGVVSLEGTLIGIAGSCIIAVIYCLGFGWSQHFLWIVLAGTIGNLLDSVFGATLERRHIIGNDTVNFCNTLLAALLLLLFV